jgi:hypothetical protein
MSRKTHAIWILFVLASLLVPASAGAAPITRSADFTLHSALGDGYGHFTVRIDPAIPYDQGANPSDFYLTYAGLTWMTTTAPAFGDIPRPMYVACRDCGDRNLEYAALTFTSVSAVPEPSCLLLLGGGLAMIASTTLRRVRRSVLD